MISETNKTNMKIAWAIIVSHVINSLAIENQIRNHHKVKPVVESLENKCFQFKSLSQEFLSHNSSFMPDLRSGEKIAIDLFNST